MFDFTKGVDILRYCAKTDKGMVREINEDFCNIIYGCSDIPPTFIIADGMGGHNSGEIASKTAVDYISNAMTQSIGLLSEGTDILHAVKTIIQDANKAVYDKSIEFTENHGMGTTLIITMIIGKIMYIGHVGDSRLYLIRNDLIKRITMDHSYIEELVRNGSLTREEAERHPGKNIITRALGCSGGLEVDTYICDIEEKDSFVLCTDGLTNMLAEDEIKRIVNSCTPEAACEELINTANSNGGEDNITVIVIKNE
jgi:PPM family protein phosphatase